MPRRGYGRVERKGDYMKDTAIFVLCALLLGAGFLAVLLWFASHGVVPPL